MPLAPVIALCLYADSFRFISDAPFEGEWEAFAFCAGVLALEFIAIFWWRRSRGAAAHGRLFALVPAVAITTGGLAIFAGWHATMGLACYAGPPLRGLHPAAAQASSVDYQTLTIVDALAVVATFVTPLLVLAGAISLVRGHRQSPSGRG
jgi:hypothetical protein